MALILTLAPGEYVTIGDNIVVQFEKHVSKSSHVVLSFSAPKSVPILRSDAKKREPRIA